MGQLRWKYMLCFSMDKCVLSEIEARAGLFTGKILM